MLFCLIYDDNEQFGDLLRQIESAFLELEEVKRIIAFCSSVKI